MDKIREELFAINRFKIKFFKEQEHTFLIF